MTRRTLLTRASKLGLAAYVGSLAAEADPSWALGGAGRAQSGGTIRVGIAAGPVNLDPHSSTLLGDQQLLENIYRGLTVLNPKTLSPVGEIAESWTVSRDELTWTFRLRPGVRFHNGREVTANDVKFSIERILDPATKASAAGDLSPIGAIHFVDRRTVAFKLKNRYGILPVALQEPAWSAIIPPRRSRTSAPRPWARGRSSGSPRSPTRR